MTIAAMPCPVCGRSDNIKHVGFGDDELGRLRAELAEKNRIIQGYQRECYDVEQELGNALGYPWYKDDQTNFPGAAEADGVCVGEHVPGTIAKEAAERIKELEDDLQTVYDMLNEGCELHAFQYLIEKLPTRLRNE